MGPVVQPALNSGTWKYEDKNEKVSAYLAAKKKKQNVLGAVQRLLISVSWRRNHSA